MRNTKQGSSGKPDTETNEDKMKTVICTVSISVDQSHSSLLLTIGSSIQGPLSNYQRSKYFAEARPIYIAESIE